MKTKVFVLRSCERENLKALQDLLDDGWEVKHATPQPITGSVYSLGSIVYILTK